MRIWDVHPGYLSRQNLLGEHRELHGMVNILKEGKTGYSRHPETLRWAGHVEALVFRHHLLAAEMRLRGYTDRTPLEPETQDGTISWPETYIDSPWSQFAILAGKYDGRTSGRLPLPADVGQFVRQHRLSLRTRGALAVDEAADPEEAAMTVTALMRTPPLPLLLDAALEELRHSSFRSEEIGTALSDLAAWKEYHRVLTFTPL